MSRSEPDGTCGGACNTCLAGKCSREDKESRARAVSSCQVGRPGRWVVFLFSRWICTRTYNSGAKQQARRVLELWCWKSMAESAKEIWWPACRVRSGTAWWSPLLDLERSAIDASLLVSLMWVAAKVECDRTVILRACFPFVVVARVVSVAIGLGCLAFTREVVAG